MKRIGAISGVVALLLMFHAPAVRAAGGGNPPAFCASPGCVVVNPSITATILVDTHQAGVTPTAGQAMIFLRQGTLTTQASFNANPTAQQVWASGCATNLTNARFLWAPPTDEATLVDWVPPFVLESLLVPFGIIASPSVVPVITQISGNQCVPPGTTAATGWLLMNATVQFLVPVTK
jgi:hypothetical protein